MLLTVSFFTSRPCIFRALYWGTLIAFLFTMTAAVMLPGGAFTYHKHEQLVQAMAGVDPASTEEIGRRFIRSYMPEQHRAFYAALESIFVCVRDEGGMPRAMALTGRAGFIHSPSPTELVISSQQAVDPVFSAGKAIGLLGLEMHTRRRNRANGVITSAEGGRLHIRVVESYGNCPKYIQARTLCVTSPDDALSGSSQHAEQSGKGALGRVQADMVRRADTFFVATHHEADADDPVGVKSGNDISHRGGPPGFVQLDGLDRLRWPDYVGNNFFQTLGNIHANHQAGLLFIDFETGATLQISGKADIDAKDVSLPGAQRAVTLQIISWVYKEGGLPLKAHGSVQASPYNPQPTDAQSRRHITCTGVAEAAEGIKTFSFSQPRTESGQSFPVRYTPGQYASFDIQDPSGEEKTLNRTWTISSHPSEQTAGTAFSITVKNVGLISGWLHSSFRKGDVLEWRGVGGEFTPQIHPGPALLIAGGIGITPMRTMALEFLKQGKQVVLLYGSRTQEDAAFLQELQQLADANPGRFKLVFSASGKGGTWTGRTGRIDKGLIAEQGLDAGATGAYMCGPEPFMAAVGTALQELGYSGNHIYSESFSF